MADVVVMGRNLRARDDAIRYMELDHCPTVLCEACTGASTTAHRNGHERSRRATGSYGVVAIVGTAAVTVSLGLWEVISLYHTYRAVSS